MEDFIKEIHNLCEKYGVSYTKPVVLERIDFFKQPQSITSTSLSSTFSNYQYEETWSEITKELNVRFLKKRREKVR